MCYDETTRLIKKYEQYVPGERPSQHTQAQNRNMRKLLRRLDLLHEITYELPFPLEPYQQKQVEKLIRRFNDSFKKLHRNTSEKTIILAFIFFIKRLEDTKYAPSRFLLCSKNGLTDNIYETILGRITEDYMKKEPINDTKLYSYDNHILQNEYPINIK